MTKKQKEMLLRALEDVQVRTFTLYDNAPEGSAEEEALQNALRSIEQAWKAVKTYAKSVPA